jgi:hypothetical protein
MPAGFSFEDVAHARSSFLGDKRCLAGWISPKGISHGMCGHDEARGMARAVLRPQLRVDPMR